MILILTDTSTSIQPIHGADKSDLYGADKLDLYVTVWEDFIQF